MSDSISTRVAVVRRVALLALVGIACLCGFHRMDSRASAGENAEKPLKRVMSLVHHARRNTLAFINQVHSYKDFDALVAGLDDPVAKVSGPDGVELASFAISGSPGEPRYSGGTPLFFMKVLADRRVARMEEMLEAMPPEEAARRARECYEAKLKNLSAMWHKILDARLDGSVPKAALDRKVYHSVCCALYLCSRFCEPAEVIEMVDDWWSAMDEVHARIHSDRRVWGFRGSDYARPAELLIFNVYLSCLQQEGALSSGELNGRLKTNTEFVTVPLVAWDAPRTSTAIARRRGTVEPWNRGKDKIESANDVDRLTLKRYWTFDPKVPGTWRMKKAFMVWRARKLVDGSTRENTATGAIIEGGKSLDSVGEEASKESQQR